MNCGFCGRPVLNGQPICEGCRKSRNRSGLKKQRKFDREHMLKEKEQRVDEAFEEEEEDASATWAEE